LHEYAGVTATAGLTTNPVVGMSAVFGTPAISFGADVAFDTATSNLTKYNAGMSLTTAELVASLSL
jgi:voltage-dependent anion channel protein 2